MTLVKIVSGAYGAKLENKTVLKTRKDPPFSLPENEASRLISLGIAEAVQNAPEIASDGSQDPSASNVPLPSGRGSKRKSDGISNASDIPDLKAEDPVM